MSIEKINEYISYIPATEVPISSDVGIIYGRNCTYVFDVGSIPESLDFLHSLNGNIKIVISHFHADHTWWLTRHKAGEEGMLPGDTLSLTYEPVKYEKLYIGKGTERYLPDGEMIREPYVIWDDIADREDKSLKLEILPMPSSHSKGSLA